jgi:ribosomal protein L37AE/L43A
VKKPVKKLSNFIKVSEDFVCENCGAKVEGSGYTNHCPVCLFSKHVDEEVPGDRKSNCKGLMVPVGIDRKHGQWRILFECEKCGKQWANRVSPADSSVELGKLVELQNKTG